jgi:type IV secretory pathway VirB10-like protein
MSNGNGSVAPQQSPSRFQFRTATGPRLSNRLYWAVGLTGAVVVGIIVWSNHHQAPSARRTEENRHGGQASPPDEIRKTADKRPASTPAPGPTATATPAPSATPVIDELAKARLQAYLAALNSNGASASDDFAKYRKAQPAPTAPPARVAMIERADPNNAKSALEVYRAHLQRDQNLPGSSPDGTDANPDRWALHATLQQPASPYVIYPGWLIDATLESGINSELPGMIKARVSRTVCDSPTGLYPLIPAGSELVGQYSNKVIYGQNRLLFVWNRINFPPNANFPNGAWLDIGAMPGVSDDGTSGGHDEVDTHFFRTFGQALLMSVITAGVGLSQPHYGGGYDTVNSTQELSAALGQNLGTAMSMLFQKNLDVAPTLKLRPGYSFHVMASKDIYLPGPYYTPDYTVHE